MKNNLFNGPLQVLLYHIKFKATNTALPFVTALSRKDKIIMKYEPTNYDGIFKYYLKSGEVRYRIRVVFTAINGRRQEKSQQGFRTLAEARAAKAKLEVVALSGDTRRLKNKITTLGQYWKDYADIKVRLGDWNKGTADTNQTRVNVWLNRYADVHLDRITRNDVQKYIIELYEENNYSQETMRGFLRILNQVIDDAVEEGYIKRNPFNKVSFKHPDKNWKPKSKQIPAPIYNKFMVLAEKDMRPDIFRCMYLLTFGLRRGEAYGITSNAITFLDNGLTQIDITRTRTSHYPEGKGVKSRDSNRVIVVDQKATTLLKEQLEFARKVKAVHNQTLHGDDFIFIAPSTGKPYHIELLNDHINKIGGQLNVNLSPHQFRHHFATRANAAGVDSLQLVKYLGHADLGMTQHYTASSAENAKNVLKKIQDFGN